MKQTIKLFVIFLICLSTSLSFVLPGAVAHAQQPLDADANYNELRSYIDELEAKATPRNTIQDNIAQWLAVQNIEQLRIATARLALETILPQHEERREFTATWVGTVKPPRTGRYVFSIHPLNINKDVPGETVQLVTNVSVNGQHVIAAGPDGWKWEGKPIELEAGASVPLRFEISYRSTDGTYADSPHAVLYWSGPGIGRQVISQESFSPPNGSGNGLQATYQWNDAGQARSTSVLDPNIEFAWATSRNVAPRFPSLVRALTDRLWQGCTHPAYIAEQAAETPPRYKHVFFMNYWSTEYLSMARRREFIDLLIQNPALLRRASQSDILRLFAVLRFGDSDRAVEMMGTWMQQRADEPPDIPQDYISEYRRFFRRVALYLIFRVEDPVAPDHFQQRFLVSNDGQCCLPVACTLAECHALLQSNYYPTKNRVEEWMAFLDQKLSDQSITGDRRVNWLLARAYAEEIRFGPPGRGALSIPDLSLGRPWLDEALLIGETPSAKQRVKQEVVHRLIARGQTSDAEQEINALAADSADPSVAALVKAWQDKLSDVEAKKKQREAAERTATEDFFRRSLQANP